MLNLKVRNLLISLFILLALAGLFLFATAKSHSDFGRGFVLYDWLMFGCVFFGAAAMLVLLLRLIKVLRTSINLLYVLVGEANFVLGVILLIIIYESPGNFFFGHDVTRLIYLANLVLGTGILGSCFLQRARAEGYPDTEY